MSRLTWPNPIPPFMGLDWQLRNFRVARQHKHPSQLCSTSSSSSSPLHFHKDATILQGGTPKRYASSAGSKIRSRHNILVQMVGRNGKEVIKGGVQVPKEVALLLLITCSISLGGICYVCLIVYISIGFNPTNAYWCFCY